MTSALLLDDRMIVVTPALIRALDGKAVDAIVVQQIHFWWSRSDNRHDGHTWVYNTYAEWAAETGFSGDQVRRAISRLMDRGLVVSCQPAGSDRTRWYRIDYDHPMFAPTGGSASVEAAELPDPQLAELPDDSLATEKSRDDNREPTSPADPETGFEDAWTLYPKRDGKKVGKQEARLVWRKLPIEDRRQIYTAIGHYRRACDAGQTKARDMVRFIRPTNRYWEDWLTPADTSTDGVRSGQRRPTVVDPEGGWQNGSF